MPENTMQEPKTNIDELAQKINLPATPEKAVWLITPMGNPDNRVPGPTDYELTAVMQFSEAETEKLESILTKNNKSKAGNVKIPEWFPADLKNSANQAGKIEGERFDAESFSQSPFLNGTILKTDDGKFYVLKMLTM